MKIKKAIFPVGGLGTRFLPATKSMPKEMLPIVDKPLIQYAVEEAAEAGIEQFIFVTSRGKSAIENHFDHSFELENNLFNKGKKNSLKIAREMLKIPGSYAYVRQQEPAGLGHAIWCARHLINDEPFAVILADDLITGKSTIKDMIDNYEKGNMVSIMEINPDQTSSYGIIKPGKQCNNLLEVLDMVEKPNITSAPSNLAIVGRYILEFDIFEVLQNQKMGSGNEIQLTDAIRYQINNSPCFGLKLKGNRYDCGSMLGFVKANIALALENEKLNRELKPWIKKL